MEALAAPIDPRIVGRAPAFVGCLAVILRDLRRLAGLHEIDALQHRVHAHREQAVEIDRAERIVVGDRRFLLDQDRAGIEAVIGPEDREAGFGAALDDRPVDRRGAAVQRQQRGVILDRAVGRDVEEARGHEQGDERHHLQIGLQRLELVPDRTGLAVGFRLVQRQLQGERGLFHRVGLLPFLVGRHIDADDVLAALDERLEHRLAECLLPMNDDAHCASPLDDDVM